ncbi:MAG: biotin/lipoyl-binding protein [Archangiaceae bacterium]|nr:biotin/lipoyl-binding protein [Archangiaceae bacterium]
MGAAAAREGGDEDCVGGERRERLDVAARETAMKTTRWFASTRKGEEPKAIDVTPLGESRYAVTLDGVKHELESLVLPHGAVSLILDGHSYAVEFEENQDEVKVLVKGQVTRVDIADERKLRMRAATAGFSVEGKQTVTAPMPGKVVKVLVKVGDEVKEGQGIVVVEAMKMENELKAPKAGKVTEVTAVEGTAVENGAKLVVIE